MFGRHSRSKGRIEFGTALLLVGLMALVMARVGEWSDLGRSLPALNAAQAGQAAAPAQATPGDPPAVPTVAADQVWRLRFRAFPDTVGKGSYACPGCDGVFGSGDEMGAAGQPLEPLMAVVMEPGNPDNVYWIGWLDRQNDGLADVRNEARVTQPPPYEVRLITVDPLGYVLCPNSPSSFFVDQDDFDAVSGGPMGSGRNHAQNWFFWRCSLPR